MSTNPNKDIVTMKSLASEQEVEGYGRLLELLQQTPVPPKEVLANLGLFLSRASLGRILFMHNLYCKIMNTPGVVMEFGVRWGQNLSLFSTFRNLYEPHNYSRKIVGFDTFEGFPAVSTLDGGSSTTQVGAYSVTDGYESYLTDVLSTHEKLAPRSHLRKFELVKGDVRQTLLPYLENHPETVIAMAYFDMDLYEPTKFCLEKIKGYLTKGSIVGFDELALAEFPGETVAVREILGLSNYRIYRESISPFQSYLVVE